MGAHWFDIDAQSEAYESNTENTAIQELACFSPFFIQFIS